MHVKRMEVPRIAVAVWGEHAGTPRSSTPRSTEHPQSHAGGGTCSSKYWRWGSMPEPSPTAVYRHRGQ